MWFGTKVTAGSLACLSAFKWSSRRDSNPHVAFTSGCTAGARVLPVARSGTVQFTVQPHVVQNKSSESRQGQTSRAPARSIKSPLSNEVLHVPTAISPALPDRCTLWHSAFVAHGSTWFGSELYPLPLKAGQVCHFPPRDVCSKASIRHTFRIVSQKDRTPGAWLTLRFPDVHALERTSGR